MKIRIELDVKPGELREFLGLPDVKGVQQDALHQMIRKSYLKVWSLDRLTA